MRALITGATGFSGRFLCEALVRRGAEVHKVSQRTQRADVRRADLCSNAAWSSVLEDVAPDCIFHVSGLAHAPELAELVRVNTLAAAALLDAVRTAKRPPNTLLFVGTAAEYGIVPPEALPVSESLVPAPRTAYGTTKLAQTQLALAFERQGVRVIVARPSNILGPGMPLESSIGSFARQLREIELGQREPVLRVGDLTTSRDFIDVRDLARTYVELALDSTFGGLVNVSAGRHVPVRSILDELIRAFGVTVSVEIDPARLRPVDLREFSASRAVLDAALGPRALIALEESVRDIVAHERNRSD